MNIDDEEYVFYSRDHAYIGPDIFRGESIDSFLYNFRMFQEDWDADYLEIYCWLDAVRLCMIRLAQAIYTGDLAIEYAKYKLFDSGLFFVFELAERCHNDATLSFTLTSEELIEKGKIGLWKGINRFFEENFDSRDIFWYIIDSIKWALRVAARPGLNDIFELIKEVNAGNLKVKEAKNKLLDLGLPIVSEIVNNLLEQGQGYEDGKLTYEELFEKGSVALKKAIHDIFRKDMIAVSESNKTFYIERSIIRAV